MAICSAFPPYSPLTHCSIAGGTTKIHISHEEETKHHLHGLPNETLMFINLFYLSSVTSFHPMHYNHSVCYWLLYQTVYLLWPPDSVALNSLYLFLWFLFEINFQSICFTLRWKLGQSEASNKLSCQLITRIFNLEICAWWMGQFLKCH